MPKPAVVVVGECTSTSARIFCCSGRDVAAPAVARIAWREVGAGGGGGQVDLDLRDAAPFQLGVFTLEGLPAGAAIEYAVAIGVNRSALPPTAAILAAPHRFRLLPVDRPPRVALVSCNGAYEISDEGRRFLLWRQLKGEIDAGRVDLVVHAGDQVYADPIWMRHDNDPELRGLTPDDGVRVDALTARYREWYVESWTHSDVAEVLASCANLMTWDDHDIFDGYGSHDGDDQPAQQAFFEAARRACADFQASHGPEPLDPGSSFVSALVHGEVGFLLLDTRSNRMWERHRVLGDEQFEAIKAWGAGMAGKLRRLYVVSSTPLVHAEVAAALTLMRLKPGTEGAEDDLRDAWTAPNNRNECQRLAKWLFSLQADDHRTRSKDEHGLQVTILSGDVHVAALGEIRSRLAAHRTVVAEQPRIFQVTSSGIGSPPPGGFLRWLIGLATKRPMTLGTVDVVGRLIPVNGADGLTMARRNFAVLNLEARDGDGAWDPYGNLRVDFHVEDRRGDACNVFPQVLNGPGQVNA